MVIRVIIADDRTDIREGLRQILTSDSSIDVVAEAASGTEAIAAIREYAPDVALVDIQMPSLDGLEVARIAGADPTITTKIIIVTTFDVDEYVYRALQYGAAGFILKRSRPPLLIEAVHAAASGERLISPSVTLRLLQQMTVMKPKTALTTSPPLTEREIEIAGEVATGKTNAEIGDSLYISPGTVKTHIATIQRKLGVKNRMGVAMQAWENGWRSSNGV